MSFDAVRLQATEIVELLKTFLKKSGYLKTGIPTLLEETSIIISLKSKITLHKIKANFFISYLLSLNIKF